MSLSKRSADMEALDPRIGMVIENSVAASRWRIAARFEGPETARRYRAFAQQRSAAATASIADLLSAGGHAASEEKFRIAKEPKR